MDIIKPSPQTPLKISLYLENKRSCNTILISPQSTKRRALICRAKSSAKAEKYNSLSGGVVVEAIQQDLKMPAKIIFVFVKRLIDLL
jgi:hypothetical protein